MVRFLVTAWKRWRARRNLDWLLEVHTKHKYRRVLRIIFGDDHYVFANRGRYDCYDFCDLYLHPFVIRRRFDNKPKYDISISLDNEFDPFSPRGSSDKLDLWEEPGLTRLDEWLIDLRESIESERARMAREKRERAEIESKQAQQVLEEQLKKSPVKRG